MKKAISLVTCAVMLLCCVCFAGCSSQSSEQTDGNVIKAEGGTQTDGNIIKAEDIQKALVNAGFTEAHIPERLPLNYEYKFVYLDKSETDCVNERGFGGNYWPKFNFKQYRDDIPEILDAVMPLYDKSFVQGDGEEVVKKLKSKRYGDIGGDIYFKSYEYRELLDDTNKFARWIIVEYKK